MGLEPTTSAVTGRRSNQLSHRANHKSNVIHALKTEYPAHKPNLQRPSLRWVSPRPISTRQLRALLRSYPAPTYLVVYEGPYRTNYVGGPILRGASRLDAFSAYPSRAWLPCRGGGPPTGAPAARPARSSRTGAGPPQISCARAG